MSYTRNNKAVKGLVALGGMALLMSAGVSNAGIEGSVHDFSGTGTDQICVNCHTPHNAQTGLDAPLWNHDASSATYTPYTSDTFDGGPITVGGVSKLCLSCHDGTVGVDSFGGANLTTGTITGNANLGSDLTNDHPFSFNYAAAYTAEGGASGGLHVDTVAVDIGGPSTKTKTGLTIASLMDGTGNMQCSSCHDVHNEFVADTTVAGVATPYKLLMVSLDGSALCLTCHNK